MLRYCDPRPQRPQKHPSVVSPQIRKLLRIYVRKRTRSPHTSAAHSLVEMTIVGRYSAACCWRCIRPMPGLSAAAAES